MRLWVAAAFFLSASPASAAPQRPVIACFGDSLTAGYGVLPEQAWPALLQARLSEDGYDYKVVNAGVSGDTTADGARRLPSVLALKPAIVVLELGANDGLRGVPTPSVRRNLSTLIRKLQAAGARVVLAGMMMPSNYGPDYTDAFKKIFPDLAREHKTALIPFFLEDVALQPELIQDDGLHPNPAGHKLVLENVWKALKPLLARPAH